MEPPQLEEAKEVDPLREEGVDEKPLAPSKQPSCVDVWPQIVASCIALSPTIQAGIGLAFSGILIPQLEREGDQELIITNSEASWIASVVVVCTPLGALVSGPLMDRLGRRLACMLTCLPIIASWLITFWADSLSQLLIARALAGFGSGMTTVGVVYTAEVAHQVFRPQLLSLNSLFVALGILMTTVLGAFLTWRTAALIFCLVACASFAASIFIPESPSWLYSRPGAHSKKAALDELARLNRPPWLLEKERERLSLSGSGVGGGGRGGKGEESWWGRVRKAPLLEPSALRPMSILVVMFIGQQLSGVYVIIFYAVNMFERVGGLDPFDSNMGLGILRFLMSVVTTGLCRVVGRRPLMLLSSLGMALCTCVAAALQHSWGLSINTLLRASNDTSLVGSPEGPASWAVPLCLLLFVCFAALGQMVIPWALIAELLPLPARGLGSGVAISFAYLLMFGVVKSFPYLVHIIGLTAVFLSFSSVALLSAAHTWWYLPETLGRTLPDVATSLQQPFPGRPPAS